jgi:hypothetical protein
MWSWSNSQHSDCNISSSLWGEIIWYDSTSCTETTILLRKVQQLASFKLFFFYYDVLWDVVTWSLTEIYRCFRGASCLHHQGGCNDDDRDSKVLRNVSKFLPEYMVQHPKRHPHIYCRENLKSFLFICSRLTYQDNFLFIKLPNKSYLYRAINNWQW